MISADMIIRLIISVLVPTDMGTVIEILNLTYVYTSHLSFNKYIWAFLPCDSVLMFFLGFSFLEGRCKSAFCKESK